MIKYGHPPRGDAGFSERLSIFWIFFLGGIMKKGFKVFLIVFMAIIIGLLIAFGIKKFLFYPITIIIFFLSYNCLAF